MEGSIYDCINHVKYVSKKNPTFEKILASMSKLDTVNKLDTDNLRKLLSGMIENQLLELSDNVYKIKGKDTIEKALSEISETETSVINETQMAPEKAVDNKVIEKQKVNSIGRPTISKNDVEPLLHDVDQSDDCKKILNVIEDHFTKIEDALIGLKMQQLSSKNKNVLDNVQISERGLVIDILKRKISDLEIELKRKNVVIDCLHSQISSKATDNSLSSSATRNLNGTSTQDSVGNKITESCHSNAAMISKHKSPIIRSSNLQSNNSQIKRKILVAGDSMLNNIHEIGLSK